MGRALAGGAPEDDAAEVLGAGGQTGQPGGGAASRAQHAASPRLRSRPMRAEAQLAARPELWWCRRGQSARSR
jgi:hypothetical protein